MARFTRSTKRAWWMGGLGVGALAALAVACGGSDSSIPAPEPREQVGEKPLPPPVQKTVGSTGGEVTSTDGSGVEVPEGAVPGDVDISVAPAPNAPPPPEAEAVVGTPYVLGPSGLQFAKPVTIVLAFDPSKLPAGKSASDILVFTAPDGTTSYKPLRTKVRDATHVEAETTHFSIFVPTIPPDDFDAGLPPPPAPDATPTCTPVLCGFYGPGACGQLADNCGGTLDCGPCPTAAPDAGTGGGGSDASTSSDSGGGGAADASVSFDAGTPNDGGAPAPDGGTSGDGGTCMPLTCLHYNACGVFNDGCSGMLDCKINCDGSDGGTGGGGSDAGTMMDAGPAPDGGCTGPTTCAELGFKCGIHEFCGTQIDCSMYCEDGGTGGGGQDGGASMDGGTGGGDAGCSGPTTCAELGFKCGIHEFCGVQIDCSMYCTDGGGGTGGGDGGVVSDGGSSCGPTKTCADYGFMCGMFDNGCGQSIDCTMYCDGGAGGGGGGAPDGGSTCVPRTCADYPGMCGLFPDTCGGEIFCDNGDPGCLK